MKIVRLKEIEIYRARDREMRYQKISKILERLFNEVKYA